MRSVFRAGVTVLLLQVGCHSSTADIPSTHGPGGTDVVCGNWGTKATPPALWSKHAPSGTTPSLRWLHGEVYDEASDKMIVFGGLGSSAPTNDVWILSDATGASGTPAWTTLATTGSAPAPRSEASVVYDPGSHTLIVYGGAGADKRFIDEFWVLTNADGSGGTSQWTKLAPTGPGPSVRFSPSTVYDPASNTMALFGGVACNSSTCTEYDEVWLLSNANGKGGTPAWSKLTVAGTHAPGRSHHRAVLDASSGAMIVFGGDTSTALTLDAAGRVSDTWVLSDVFAKGGAPAWKQLAPTSPPIGLTSPAAVYDSSSNRLMIFGGSGTDKYVHNGVYVLTNANGTGGAPAWGRLNTGTPEPSGRDTAAVYSPTKNRMVIFAGNVGDDKLANDAWVLRDANGVASAAPAKVTISAPSKSVCVGYGMQLVAIGADAGGKTIEGGLVSWSTTDTTVCEVDEDGWLTVGRTGTCEVTATIDGVISDPVDVIVETPTSTGGGGGGDETWVVLRPDGAPATVKVSGGSVSQVAGKAWTMLNATGDCSFAVALSGTIAGTKWQLTGEGSGCGGYHTSCTLTGTSDGSTASGSATCKNDTPAGSITDNGTWTATKQ